MIGWMPVARQARLKATAPYSAWSSVSARWLSPSAAARWARASTDAVPPRRVKCE
ncbi:MAG: hypothetical protein V9H69_12795 [Anaerolineae bacterium]